MSDLALIKKCPVLTPQNTSIHPRTVYHKYTICRIASSLKNCSMQEQFYAQTTTSFPPIIGERHFQFISNTFIFEIIALLVFGELLISVFRSHPVECPSDVLRNPPINRNSPRH